MEKETLLRGFAIAMGLMFVAEIFLIVVPQSQTPVPTATPGASATPEPEFIGSASTTASVTDLGRRILANCNATGDAAGALRALPSVSTATYDARTAIADVVLADNASLRSAYSDIRGALSPLCTPVLFVQAYLTFNQTVRFASSTEANVTKAIAPALLACGSGSYYCYAFVLPNRKAGDIVNVSAFGRFSGGVATRLFIQEETAASGYQVVRGTFPGHVTALEYTAQATFILPWNRRNFNASKLQADLFDRGEYQEDLGYFPDPSIVLSGNYSNRTLEAVGNLSFVRGLAERGNETTVAVADNFTDEAQARKALETSGVNGGQLSFPNSTLAFKFGYTDFNKTVSFLTAQVGQAPELLGTVNVHLDDPDEAEAQLGAVWDQKRDPLQVFAPLNTSYNQSVNVTVSAAVFLGTVNSFVAQWAG